MPRIKKVAIIPEAIEQEQDHEEEQNIVVKQPEPVKKRTRTMSAEALEKLKLARQKALEVKKVAKQINAEHEKVRKQTYGEKVDEIETYKKIKERVDNELKQNEIVAINQRINDIHSKFNEFLADRQQRKIEKAQRKEQKRASEIARELPAAMSKQLLEQQLKEMELQRFKYNVFGVR